MIGVRLGPWIGKKPKDIPPEEMARLRKPIERAILKAELLLEATVKQKLLGPRHGRIYPLPTKNGKVQRRRQSNGRFSKKGSASRDFRGRFIKAGTYQASAPGEPPATVTGRFRQSITHSPVAWDGDTASGDVRTDDVRAHIFEFGGIAGNGARILARPYMAPSYLEAEPKLVEILGEVVKS